MSIHDRLDLYLQWDSSKVYTNTDSEQLLLNKFATLYSQAKTTRDNMDECSPTNLSMWRRAYLGTLNALKADGSGESAKRSRQLRKMAYEIIESKIDNGIPMPKLQPRYKTDLPLVNITESYLKFEVDRIMTKYLNDRSERSTYVDGTGWYKVWWDSLDNTHERSGNTKIDFCTVDQIVPQPGIMDYKQMEYIFEIKDISVSRLYDLYGRLITPTASDASMVTVISCYYLNENRVVGLFMWSRDTMQVICNETDWQIRKLRTCTTCHTINPVGDTCRNCGQTSFKYENATVEILDEDINEIYNPYEVGETEDPQERKKQASRVFVTAGTTIPFYQIRQLPFIPRPAVSSMNSIYGISEVKILLEMQDAANKILTKAVDKTLKSGTVVTKPEKVKIGDSDDTFKIIGVRTAEEASMVQSKQILADTTGDMVIANLLYDSGKASSGITASFQGARDTTATSGKAKEYSALQTAGRIESLRVMKAAAFSGIYELILKYLLAFSDETRRFVRVLPDGSEKEEAWSKHMFLDKDKYGQIYYRDDLHFDSDPASTLSQNRVSMWQETSDKFLQGAFGVPNDPRTLKLYWNIMDSFQYPLAKVALASITETEQHLPFDIEQLLMQNPEILQMALASVQENRGGARANSGPDGNGATHSANVERTNTRNKAENKSTAFTPQSSGAQTIGGALT